MNETKNTIAINVVVHVPTAALEAVVETAKKLAGPNAKGHYKVDTADKISEMITNFLLEKDFESYVKNESNYQA